MLRFLSDENFNEDIIRGVLLQKPNLDLVRVQDVGMRGVIDPTLLDWAATQRRILLTHDRATMPDFAYRRLVQGGPMAGLFVVNDRVSTSRLIDELVLIVDCTEVAEWEGVVAYIPL